MGLENLPLRTFAQNRIWCSIVALASEITAWMGLLAHPEVPARRRGPKRLRHRLFQVPATFARHARVRIVHLSDRWDWAVIVEAGRTRLCGLPCPLDRPAGLLTAHDPEDPARWKPGHRDDMRPSRHTLMPESPANTGNDAGRPGSPAP